MMKLNIPIWYLETDLKFIDFIIDDNIAHKIVFKDIDLLFDENKEYVKIFSPLYDNKKYSEIFDQENSDQLIIDETPLNKPITISYIIHFY